MESNLDIQNSNISKTILNLENIDKNIYRANYITAKSRRGIFGGQLIGQALISANGTVPENMNIHSMHSYFILPGDTTLPVVYNIEITRDGLSFCTRIVKAIQKGQMIFTAMVSYQKLEVISYTFQTKMPDVPNPESLPLYQDFLSENLKSSTLSDKWKRFIFGYLHSDKTFDIKLASSDWLTCLLNNYTSDNRPIRLLLWIKFKDLIADKI